MFVILLSFTFYRTFKAIGQWKSESEKLQTEAPKPIELEEVHDPLHGHDGNDDTAPHEDVDLPPLQEEPKLNKNQNAPLSQTGLSALDLLTLESRHRGDPDQLPNMTDLIVMTNEKHLK